MRALIVLILAACSSPVLAQQGPEREPTIQVSGFAKVTTKPDVATLAYWVSGEGKTADEASSALAAKQKAIVAGLMGLLGRNTELSSANVTVIETRAADCNAQGGYNSRMQLSEGICAVTGYIASLRGSGRTLAIDKAGTAAGLAARLGARDARVEAFDLRDRGEAQRRATAAAIADARTKAVAMAAGAGVKLGRLVSLNDQSGTNDIVVTGAYASEFAPPPAPPPPAPVEIAISPQPIETSARVFAQFAIAP